MRPVLARFARTLTPAACSRSASSGAVGLSFTASSSSRCRRWRGGSSPDLTAMLISLSVSFRRSARASPSPGVRVRPWVCSSSWVASMARRASHWPSHTFPSSPTRLATMWMWSLSVSWWRTATHGVLVWSKPMRCMKSAVTASHFSALRRSPGGSDSEQCQTGLSMSGRNWRTAENSRDSSRGSFPAMLPPTRSAFFVCVASLPTSKT